MDGFVVFFLKGILGGRDLVTKPYHFGGDQPGGDKARCNLPHVFVACPSMQRVK